MAPDLPVLAHSRYFCLRLFSRAVLLCCAILAAGPAQSAVIELESGATSVPVGRNLSVFEDKTAQLDIEAMASTLYAGRYEPVARERPNYGFRRSALWFRLQVDFRQVAGHEWHLVESHPLIDELTFFLPEEDGRWKAIRMGDELPFASRPYALREFVLPVPRRLIDESGGPVTVYVRVAGMGALNVDLRLVNAQGLAESSSNQAWGFGLFYGALLIMFGYNLFLYFSTQERAQRHYIVFLGGFILLFFSLNGFGLQYLWPDRPAINGWFPVFTCISIWGALQFTRSFLDIRRDNPGVDTAFRVMTHAVWVIFFLGLLLPRHWAYILGTVMPLFFALMVFAAGVFRLRQNYAPARLFVTAWALLLAGSVLLPLANLGLLPINFITEYASQFGVVMQVLLLSVALGERMKLLKQENERIQQESHRKLAATFAELKSLDADKMRFLNYLSHELNTPLNWMSAARHAGATPSAESVRDMLEMVETGQQRMMDLVAIVMRYFDLAAEDPSRISTGSVAPMWLVDELLRGKAAEISAQGVTVSNRVPPDLIVQANEQRLRRILECLIDNAIHFSPAGQEVVIEGNLETYGTRGAITVTDHGSGIDPEQRAHIFEPFFMVGSQHREGGFGLSLATSRLLAVNMGGDIRVRSEGRGTGAAFTLVLPTGASAANRPA